jgi:hypothetical protein
MRAAPATIGGMPRSSNLRQRAAVGDQLALALHDVEAHRRLAVLEGGELLRLGDRNGGVARDHLLGQAAHRLQAERERDHVEQQPVVGAGAVAGQHVGLHGGAQRDHLVRVEVGQRLLLEVLGHGALHLRHARGAADHHHALDVVHRQAGVAQRLARRAEGLGDQRPGHLGESVDLQRQVHLLARGQLGMDRRLVVAGQHLLGLARLEQQAARVLDAGKA